MMPRCQIVAVDHSAAVVVVADLAAAAAGTPAA